MTHFLKPKMNNNYLLLIKIVLTSYSLLYHVILEQLPLYSEVVFIDTVVEFEPTPL
jgi:hypothetical protein